MPHYNPDSDAADDAADEARRERDAARSRNKFANLHWPDSDFGDTDGDEDADTPANDTDDGVYKP